MHYYFPLNIKTSLFLGSYYNLTNSHQVLDAASKDKASGEMVRSEALSNDFLFNQTITNFRAAIKRRFKDGLSFSTGLAAENTSFNFDLYKTDSTANNHYLDILPFATLVKDWEDVLNLRLTYRKSIGRPGITQLNPSIDNSDPFNLRFGNPDLVASTSHNFDLVLGKSNRKFYANLGLGYNIVKDIFSQIRTPVSDRRTEITWQNISGKKEYELNSWNGYTFSKKLRVNMGVGYTYNKYSDYDKEFRAYKDGGSFSSNLNANYIFSEVFNSTGSFTFNRFANPQGSVRGSVSLNLGLQAKWFQKKLITTLNIIDPFNQQEYRSFTYGKNFFQENHSSTRTRNFRLSVSYNLSKMPKKPKGKEIDKKELQNLIKK